VPFVGGYASNVLKTGFDHGDTTSVWSTRDKIMLFDYRQISRESGSEPSFWATVCKTVRPMLSDRCLSCSVCPVLSVLSCLSVGDVGVLWPNRWIDQNEI